jgi:hypothetical protein
VSADVDGGSRIVVTSSKSVGPEWREKEVQARRVANGGNKGKKGTKFASAQ